MYSRTDSVNSDLKEMVRDGKKVFFQYYRENELWYKTESGFMFPVPISDVGNATMLAEDKAILFMRYIRPQLWKVKEEITQRAIDLYGDDDICS